MEMQCYRVTAINGEGEYWLLANSEDEARRVVALNAGEARTAEDSAEYSAYVDEQKRPPHYLIIRKSSYPAAIEKR